MTRNRKNNNNKKYTSSLAAMIMCAVIGISALGFSFAAPHAAAKPESKPKSAYSVIHMMAMAGERAYSEAINNK